ncbi:aldo/keto reductase [Novosphingobium sp. YJ-S2-02]|uniref:Aldo/keto reductase n=1 Tax=Novosphingobium aureum TaxID=2792964 RepID=A0A931MLI6_9SPHN|nr:aldo/keto reductase [Novosphingobium aureum]MBH0113963.1 aldo/keto reductase [Novosphingobium aureum]
MDKDLDRMSPIALGCARIGSFNNPRPLVESRRLIVGALDLGVTTIDTSDIYGQGDSEIQIGKALAGRRDQAFIVTKTGRRFSARMRLLRPLKPFVRPLLAARGRRTGKATAGNRVTRHRESELTMDWTPAAMVQGLEASLRRLRSDYVDGFLLHSPDAGVAADPEVARSLCGLRQQGKVRHFGVSCDDRENFEAALTMPGISLVQLPWDVVFGFDNAMIELLRSRGIAVMAREIIRLQPALSPAQAVLAASAHPAVRSTLVGTTRLDHLESLVSALARVPGSQVPA